MTTRASVTATTLKRIGWRLRFSVVLAAPRLGDTDQLNLVYGSGFCFQKALNHLATGSRGKFSFICPLQSRQLRREGMESDGRGW